VLGPIGGKLADRYGSTIPLRTGLASLFIGLALLSTFGTSGSAITVSVLGIFVGAGMGLAGAPLLNSVSLVLPQSQAGMGIGLVHMLFLMGGSFGVTLMTAILDARAGITNSINVLHSGAGPAFADTFLLGCLTSAAALLLSTFVKVPKPGELDAQPSAFDTVRSHARPSKT
jgi:MFS family permease